MRRIVLLTGPHGSGKTSLADALDEQGLAIRLRQYTTRKKRDGESDEYRFVVSPQPDALWRYMKAGSEYGFATSELASLPEHATGVIAVHTEAIHGVPRGLSGVNILTVGLDTLASHSEQLARVNQIEGRLQSHEAFEESRKLARAQDICLSGDFATILKQLQRIVEQQTDTQRR